MSKETSEVEGEHELRRLAIEDTLPLKAVGIENLKEDNPKHMPPTRYLFPWYARRPTPAARLAVLASVLPAETTNEELLELMQISPRFETELSLEEYVEHKKDTEDQRIGTFEDHYGYPRPYTSTPSPEEQDEFHQILRDFWNGSIPTVFDPTAGSGVIPLESLRYGLPTIANELNPVPSLMLKVVLEYPVSIGNLRHEVLHWGEIIDERASERLSEYYPSDKPGQTPSLYICTYKITCANCGCDMPIPSKLWILKRSATEGIAAQPVYSDGNLRYKRVELPNDITKSEFDPNDGPRSRGGNTECPNCAYVTESDEVKKRIVNREFEDELIGVKYSIDDGGSGYRLAAEEDFEALEKAANRIETDFDLFTFLEEEIPQSGEKTSELAGYGFSKWRDLYTDRQLVAHYEYWRAYDEFKSDIEEDYESEKAEAILSILSLAGAKMIDRNARLSPYNFRRGYPMHLSGTKNLTPQWLFVDNNPSSGDQSYLGILDRVLGSYEKIVGYLKDVKTEPAKILNQDAAELPLKSNSIDAIVIDPPYYSSIMYAELSDMFYVMLRRYMQDVHSEMFSNSLTNKEDEAVANPSLFDDIAGDLSKKELAKREYESKMSDIFSELYRTTKSGGVLTVMFTHKETDAWDTLTTSLINSGFTITGTHPITSERPNRADTQGGGSADSTLLLVGRKPLIETDPNKVPTLWNDVRAESRNAAKTAAQNLLESGLSLTKTDVIISAFGPTLKIFAENHPVVDDEGNEIPPKKALEEARTAVTEVLVEEYLQTEGVGQLDALSEWYVLTWLVYESDTVPYDEARQLGLGLGVDIDEIKRSAKIWKKSKKNIILQGHKNRVKNINKDSQNRSSRKPINPESLTFSSVIDKVHAALHVYDAQGENEAWNWLDNRNCDTDTEFKTTLEALLEVLPPAHDDWQIARDLSVGKTGDLLSLDLDSSMFEEGSKGGQSTMRKFSE